MGQRKRAARKRRHEETAAGDAVSELSPLPSYKHDVHTTAPPPANPILAEAREEIVRRLDAFVDKYRSAKRFADDFLRRYDRCPVLREWWLSSPAVANAACGALLEAWQYETSQRVIPIDPTSREGRRLTKVVNALRAIVPLLRQRRNAADIAQRAAEELEAQLADRPRRGAPEQRRAVYCVDRALQHIPRMRRQRVLYRDPLLSIPRMSTRARHQRVAELMSAWSGGRWTRDRVKTATRRIKQADEKFFAAMRTRYANRSALS